LIGGMSALPSAADGLDGQARWPHTVGQQGLLRDEAGDVE
jgi:hypothetical protein